MATAICRVVSASVLMGHPRLDLDTSFVGPDVPGDSLGTMLEVYFARTDTPDQIAQRCANAAARWAQVNNHDFTVEGVAAPRWQWAFPDDSGTIEPFDADGNLVVEPEPFAGPSVQAQPTGPAEELPAEEPAQG